MLLCLQLYTGHASDGDARRRKAMLSMVFQGTAAIPSENFSLSAGSFLMDQDYVHNIKKLVNPLDHISKDLRIGR